MNTMTTALIPQYENRKSFYDKAIVETNGCVIRLYSYGTHVATSNNDAITIHGSYSATTWRHVREWVAQLTGERFSTAQLIDKYVA